MSIHTPDNHYYYVCQLGKAFAEKNIVSISGDGYTNSENIAMTVKFSFEGIKGTLHLKSYTDIMDGHMEIKFTVPAIETRFRCEFNGPESFYECIKSVQDEIVRVSKLDPIEITV